MRDLSNKITLYIYKFNKSRYKKTFQNIFPIQKEVLLKIKYNQIQYNMQKLVRKMRMLNTGTNSKLALFVLIMQFWLSGLWILSLIFTAEDTQHLDHTNMLMFITLGVGSLVGGYLSDIFDRILIFKLSSLIWLFASVIVILNMEIGYIIAAGAIGLLNNLTFVIIMENWSQKKDLYTIYVLVGWAASQITLGLLFYAVQDRSLYFSILFGLTLVYTIAALLFLKPSKEQNQQLLRILHQQIQAQQNMQMPLNQDQPILNTLPVNQQAQDTQIICKRIFPHSILPLIGGCILMFVMQMFYYRTQFTLDRFGISLQLNTIIVGVMEVTANLIFTKFINRYPRNAFLRVFIVLLAGLFFGLVFISDKVVQTLIEGIMRLFDTCIMIVLGVYLPELFQKDERGKGTNYIMSFGVLGSALNSVILNSFKFWQLIFFLLIGFLSTFCFKQTFPLHPNEEQNDEPITKIN